MTTVSGYLIANAEPGTWTANLQAASLPSASTSYYLAVTLQSPITLAAGLDQPWYAPGATAAITASLGGGVSASAVTAQVQRPDGVTDNVVLTPQGNGQYIGTETLPATSGYGAVVITAQGNDSQGHPFSRQGTTTFLIGGQDAVLNGSYADQLTDADGDGIPDALSVSVGVTPKVAGAYTVSAQLVAPSSGTMIAQTSTSADLSAGAQTVVLDFPGSAIYASGVDGPYEVTSVLLTETNSAVGLLPLQSALNVWTTQAYNHNVFGSGPPPSPTLTPTLTPVVSATPTPTPTPSSTPSPAGSTIQRIYLPRVADGARG